MLWPQDVRQHASRAAALQSWHVSGSSEPAVEWLGFRLHAKNANGKDVQQLRRADVIKVLP